MSLKNILSLFLRHTRGGGPYADLSRKQLEHRLAQFEFDRLGNNNNNDQSPVTTATAAAETTRQQRQRRAQFDQHRIALQVSYLGWNYYGFTSSNAHTEKTNPTVQGQLMKALLQAKLIQDPDSCEFTLSGRTDTGVSGMGQVIALNVRKTSGSDLPYLRMLNSALPPDIRVLGWTPVPDSFNARFDCRSRTYHYYFPANNDICIDRIRKAATYLLGEHDFRNFCKFNPSKNLAHYRRTILSVNVTTTTSADKHRPSFARLEIKGTAFLWHQVRCIVSILLLVGQRLEEPEVVQWLLDVDRVPGKPEYPLASSLPLVLYECDMINKQEDNNGDLIWHRESTERTRNHLRLLWGEQMTKALLYESFLKATEEMGKVSTRSSVKRIQLGASKEILTSSYKPLMDRRRSDPYSLKQQKYNTSHTKV